MDSRWSELQKELLFKRADGVVIETVRKHRVSAGNSIQSLRDRNEGEGLDITPDTGVTKWDGVPMDYHMAVDELLVRRERSLLDGPLSIAKI